MHFHDRGLVDTTDDRLWFVELHVRPRAQTLEYPGAQEAAEATKASQVSVPRTNDTSRYIPVDQRGE